MNSHAAWLSLVQASVLPETGERVNVGLLVGENGSAELRYHEGLPRMAGVLTTGQRAVVQSLLAVLAREARRGVGFEALERMAGPQLCVTAPRPLEGRLDRDTLRGLERVYLEPATERVLEKRAEKVREEGERRLRGVLTSIVPATGPRPVHGATPAKLYGDSARLVFSAHVPQIAYAVRFRREDWLFDGVVILPGHVEAAVRNATARIDRAFWHYKTARERLQSVAGVRTRTVGMLFDGQELGNADVAEARQYIEHLWHQHADIVVDAERPEQIAELRGQLLSR